MRSTTTLQLIAPLHKATHQVGLYLYRELRKMAVSQDEAYELSHLSQ